MPSDSYSGTPREYNDRTAAAGATGAANKAVDTEKLTSVAGLASKMSAPKRFWHMPTSRWVETDDPEYKTLLTSKDEAKSISSPKSISSSKSLSGGK